MMPLVVQRRRRDAPIMLGRGRGAGARLRRFRLPRGAGRLHEWRALAVTAKRFAQRARFSARDESATQCRPQTQGLPAVGFVHGPILALPYLVAPPHWDGVVAIPPVARPPLPSWRDRVTDPATR